MNIDPRTWQSAVVIAPARRSVAVVLAWALATTGVALYDNGSAAAQPISTPTPSSTPTATIPPVGVVDGRVAEIQAMVDARVAALSADDEAAYLAAIDVSASPEFVERERQSFRGTSAMTFSIFRIEISAQRSGNLGEGQFLAQQYGAEVFLPETRLIYQLQGFDTVDAIDVRWYTYVERNDQWFIASDSDVTDLGLEGDLAPWDLGPVAQLASDRVLVLSSPDATDRARQVLSLTEAALDQFATLFELPWSGKVVVVVPRSAAELAVLLRSTNELSDFVAFVNYDANRDTDWQATAPRMYLQDENLSQRSVAYQVDTIVHELAHYASASYAGPRIPGWVHEGVADWIAKGRTLGEARPAESDGIFPNDADLGYGDPNVINTSYAESRSVMAWMSAAVRPSAPIELFQVLGAYRSVPGSDGYHLDAAVRQITGVSLVDLQAAWAAS